MLQWVKAFLEGRQQRVLLQQSKSPWKPVSSGVPQGSILGPVLFLLYVNDIPNIVESTAKMFADDTKVYRVSASVQKCEILQQDLNKLSAWSRKWLLKFNADKCVVLRLRQAIDYLYTLDNVYLLEVVDQKDLGVTVTNDLKPRTHITIMTKKANQKIGIIRRCFSDLTSEKVTILYTTIIRPILEYASPTWNPWTKHDIQTLEKTQRRCLRLCKEHIDLPSLEQRRRNTDIVETYKILNNLYTVNPDKYFQRPHRDLRGHSQKLFQPRTNSEVRRNFFSSRVIKDWNRLPAATAEAPTLAAFKHAITSGIHWRKNAEEDKVR